MSDKKKSPLASMSFENILLYLRRHIYLTAAIISWVVMGILTLLIVVPQINLIISDNDKLAIEQQKLTDLQAKSQFLQAQNLSDLSTQKSMLDQVLPAEKPVIPLISSIEQMATDANVLLTSYELTPGSIATDAAATKTQARSLVPGIGSLPLKLETQGVFASMNAFFKSLDNLVPLVNVKTIDFTVLSQSRGAAPADIQYRASVELDSLYALPDTTRPDLNAKLIPLSVQQKQLIASLSAQVAAQPQITSITAGPSATGSALPRQSIFSY